MPSFQNSAPGSKSEKFVDGLNSNVNNIFAPFLAEPGDLGGGTNNNEPDPLSEFDTRLRLQERRGFIPNSNNEATTAGIAQQQQELSNDNPVKKTNINDRPVYSIDNNINENKEKEGENGDDDDDDSSEDYDYLLDDDIDDGENGDGDAVLAAIRQKRLNELKRQHIQIREHKSKGHGEYRIITQDEFLPECTNSKWVLVNFFHDDFERCKIMDYHLKRIATPHHLKCKFVGVNAAKCPFFVQKLNVKTLPTLIVFHDGKAVDRLIGFDGLSNNPKKPDEFTTSSLGRWIESTKAIDEYVGPDDSDVEEEEGNNNQNNKGRYQSRFHTYDEDN